MAFTYERIDDETTRISGYTLPIKEILKRHQARFESSSRTWLVPTSEVARLQSDIKVWETREKVAKQERWSKALSQCGLDFVNKGTLEYQRVLAVYKTLA